MAGLTRKELLAGAAAAGVVAGCGGSPKPRRRPGRLGVGEGAVRARPACATSTRSCSPRTRGRCGTAIERHRRGLDADAAGYVHAHELELDGRGAPRRPRATSACSAADLAFTDSTTMGLGLVYGGIRGRTARWSDHRARLLRDPRGAAAALRPLPAGSASTTTRRSARVDGIVDAVSAASTARTRPARAHLGALGHRREAAARARSSRRAGERRTLLVVDGVHGLGAGRRAVRSTPAATSSSPARHKWLARPARHRPRLEPRRGIACSRRRSRRFDAGHARRSRRGSPPAATTSFEHRWALAEAFDVPRPIGRSGSRSGSPRSPRACKEGLADVPERRASSRRCRRRSPPASSASTSTALEPGDGGRAAARRAPRRRLGHAVRVPYVRFGVLWVDEADVDAAVRAVSRL